MSEENQKASELFKIDKYSIVTFIVLTGVISITSWYIPILKELLSAPDNFALFLAYVIVRGGITLILAGLIALPLRRRFRK